MPYLSDRLGSSDCPAWKRALVIHQSDRGRLGYFAAEIFGKHARVVREDLGVVRGARHGNIRKTRIDEFGMNICVDDAGVEGDDSFLTTIHANCDCPVSADLLNGSQVTTGNPQFPVGRRPLDPVADGKLPLDLTVSADAAQPRWVVGDLFPG